MALALTRRGRGIVGGRAGRQADRQQEAFQSARDEEMARQKKLREDEMRRDIFQTTEGGGIMEGASISLGFDEDEDDLFDSMTGLIV